MPKLYVYVCCTCERIYPYISMCMCSRFISDVVKRHFIVRSKIRQMFKGLVYCK